jgi:alpha-tubulin suppressor-like RCC1 family protein
MTPIEPMTRDEAERRYATWSALARRRRVRRRATKVTSEIVGAAIVAAMLAWALFGLSGLDRGVRPSPAHVPPARPAVVSVGYYSACAITATYGVRCWGYLSGDGTREERALPVEVVGLQRDATSVAAGRDFACASIADGTVRCWGDDNRSGQLGNASREKRLVPIEVAGLSGVVAVAAGWQHACAMTNEGGVKCWGENENGQLGDGTTTSRSDPRDVAGLTSGVSAIAAGQFHTCALTDAGAVKCWGGNDWGQLGDGTTIDRLLPTDVVGLGSAVVSIASGLGPRTCAITTDRTAMCWGNNESGALGDGTLEPYRSAPTPVVGLPAGISQISTGLRNTCAVHEDGGTFCWGDNEWEVLGPVPPGRAGEPVEMDMLPPGIVEISVGSEAQCALSAGGRLYCAGRNENGQLGAGVKLGSWSGDPLPVPGVWAPPT